MVRLQSLQHCSAKPSLALFCAATCSNGISPSAHLSQGALQSVRLGNVHAAPHHGAKIPAGNGQQHRVLRRYHRLLGVHTQHQHVLPHAIPHRKLRGRGPNDALHAALLVAVGPGRGPLQEGRRWRRARGAARLRVQGLGFGVRQIGFRVFGPDVSHKDKAALF